MINSFPQTLSYLQSINIEQADALDKIAYSLLQSEDAYERASQALRRRFVRGALEVEGIDRSRRLTKIKRDKDGGKYKYLVMGTDGTWSMPNERIWVVAMYALWQQSK